MPVTLPHPSPIPGAAKPDTAERLVFGGTLAVLVFAPLPFGSVHVWAYTLCITAVVLLLGLQFIRCLLVSGAAPPCWVRTPLTLPAALLAVLTALQLTPLPAGWLARLSPLAAADQAVVAEVLAGAGGAVTGWAAAAYHRHAAFVEGLKLFSAFGVWLLVVHTARTRRRIDTLALALTAVGLFEALYAIGQAFSAAPRVWWWPARSAHFASGTFVGSNHFASYMALVMPLTLGLAMAQRSRGQTLVQGLKGRRAVLQRLVGLFSPGATTPRRMLLCGAALVMGLALLLSGSRGGTLATAGAFALVGGMLVARRHFRLHGLVTTFFCLAALLCGLMVGIDPTLDKFGKAEAGFDLRWRRTLSMAPMMADYPLTGVGLGNWRHLYERYAPDGIGFHNAGHAHNDWFEAGAELGVAGLAVLVGGYGAVLTAVARAWRRRRDPHAVGLGAGTIAGMTALALHSFFEFSLHIPANPLTLAAVAGLGFAAVHRRRCGLRERFAYGTRSAPASRLARGMAAAAVALVLGGALNVAWRHLYAETRCPTEWNSTLNLEWDPPLAEVRRAIAANPANAACYFKAATRLMSQRADTPAGRQAINDSAIGFLEPAVRLNPGEARYWFHLGKRYSFRDADPVAYLDRWLPLADRCLDMAARCGASSAQVLFDVAWYWVWRASILPVGPGESAATRPVVTRQAAVNRFQALFSRSLAMQPARWKKAVARVREYFTDPAVALGSLPPDDADLRRRAVTFLGGDP